MKFRGLLGTIILTIGLSNVAFAGADGGEQPGDDDDPITDITIKQYPPPWHDPKIPGYDKLPPGEQKKLDDEWRKNLLRRRQNVSEGLGLVMTGLGR